MDRSTAENDVIKLPSTGESRRAEGLIPSLLNDNADLRLRYSRVISRAGPRVSRQRGVSNLPSYRGDTRRKRRVTQRAVETCVLARTAALMHGVPATFHFLRPVSFAGVLLAFLPSDIHRMRWMHRTPGRDACRRTKTLEGCQPFERVTSAFLLPSSYRIFLLASLPPESGRDRGREISAGSLPSSRDAELFRVVTTLVLPSSNQPFIHRCPTFSSREFSRVYREQGKSVRVALPWRIIPSNCAPRQLGQTFILRELSASCSIGPRRIRPRETPQLSSPFSSKAIDRDKEPQTLPCRRCEFLPLVPPSPKFTAVFADLSRVARLKSTVGRICRERWDRGQQKPGLAIPGLAIIATSSRGLAIYH